MSKFCVNCGTENNDEYNFCKSCGAALNYDETGGGETSSQNDLKEFIGPNSDKIIPKFMGMELASSRVSWCWAAAILSFVFGFFGTAIWFFYRKLYKPAFICVAIGSAFCLANMLITYDATMLALSQSFDVLKSIFNDPQNSVLELQSLLEGLGATAQGINITSLLSDLEMCLAVAFGGMFSLSIYRKIALSKIEQMRLSYGNDENFKFRLNHSGGVSGGMAFLGVVLMLGITAVIESIPVMVFITTLQ